MQFMDLEPALAQDIDLASFPKELVKLVQCRKGEWLFQAGEPFSYFYQVHTGFAKSIFVTFNGSYQVNRFSMKGNWIGLKGAGQIHYPLSVMALTDCQFLGIKREILYDILARDREFAQTFEAMRSRLLIHSEEHLLVLANYTNIQKVAYFLLDFQYQLKQVHLNETGITLPMNREDLKSYLGMTMESLSRAFGFLEDVGYMKVRNRLISEIDFERLGLLLNNDKERR